MQTKKTPKSNTKTLKTNTVGKKQSPKKRDLKAKEKNKKFETESEFSELSDASDSCYEEVDLGEDCNIPGVPNEEEENSHYKEIVDLLNKDSVTAHELARTEALKKWGTGPMVQKVLASGKVNPPAIVA